MHVAAMLLKRTRDCWRGSNIAGPSPNYLYASAIIVPCVVNQYRQTRLQEHPLNKVSFAPSPKTKTNAVREAGKVGESRVQSGCSTLRVVFEEISRQINAYPGRRIPLAKLFHGLSPSTKNIIVQSGHGIEGFVKAAAISVTDGQPIVLPHPSPAPVSSNRAATQHSQHLPSSAQLLFDVVVAPASATMRQTRRQHLQTPPQDHIRQNKVVRINDPSLIQRMIACANSPRVGAPGTITGAALHAAPSLHRSNNVIPGASSPAMLPPFRHDQWRTQQPSRSPQAINTVHRNELNSPHACASKTYFEDKYKSVPVRLLTPATSCSSEVITTEQQLLAEECLIQALTGILLGPSAPVCVESAAAEPATIGTFIAAQDRNEKTAVNSDKDALYDDECLLEEEDEDDAEENWEAILAAPLAPKIDSNRSDSALKQPHVAVKYYAVAALYAELQSAVETRAAPECNAVMRQVDFEQFLRHHTMRYWLTTAPDADGSHQNMQPRLRKYVAIRLPQHGTKPPPFIVQQLIPGSFTQHTMQCSSAPDSTTAALLSNTTADDSMTHSATKTTAHVHSSSTSASLWPVQQIEGLSHRQLSMLLLDGTSGIYDWGPRENIPTTAEINTMLSHIGWTWADFQRPVTGRAFKEDARRVIRTHSSLAWFARLPHFFDIRVPDGTTRIEIRRSPLLNPSQVGMTLQEAFDYVRQRIEMDKMNNGPVVMRQVRRSNSAHLSIYNRGQPTT